MIRFKLKGHVTLEGMGKMKKLIALLAVVILISLGTVVYAADGTENQKETLVVKNWKGTHIGTVNYVVVNPYTGNVTFVILYLDNKGKKEIVAPLAAFSSYDPENATLILNVPENELASAPEFHDSDLNDPAFAERVYRFFGLVPSWTEDRIDEEKRI